MTAGRRIGADVEGCRFWTCEGLGGGDFFCAGTVGVNWRGVGTFFVVDVDAKDSSVGADAGTGFGMTMGRGLGRCECAGA